MGGKPAHIMHQGRRAIIVLWMKNWHAMNQGRRQQLVVWWVNSWHAVNQGRQQMVVWW